MQNSTGNTGFQPTRPPEELPPEMREEAAPPEQSAPKPPEEAKAETKKKRRRRRWRAFRSLLLRTFFLALVVYVLLFHIVGITSMPSGDMYPRIDSGDLVLFYRLERSYKYQDVVVIDKAVREDGTAVETPDLPEPDFFRRALNFLGFRDPALPATTRFVCRVIAGPGDTVDFPEGTRMTVNGNALVETNIFYTTQAYEGVGSYPITLGVGEYFVLADYRRGGVDSRFFGPVTEDEIQGTVITIMRRNNL